jgi:UDP-N-acetyl-D-glucosamine dehydrogenase
VLGVAYKKDVDDLRESPSLRIIELLQERGLTDDRLFNNYSAVLQITARDHSSESSQDVLKSD